MAKLLGLDNDGQVIGRDVKVPSTRKTVKTPLKIIEDGESIPYGYTDITSIERLEEHGYLPELKRDYGSIRKAIKHEIAEKGRATAISTINDPSTITKAVGDRYIVGSNPVNGFANQFDLMAIVKDDLSWEFRDPEALGYFELTTEERKIAIKYNIGDLEDHEADTTVGYTVSEIQFINVEYHIDSVANREYRRRWVESIIYRDLPDHKGQVYQEMTFSPVGNLIANYKDAGLKGTVEDHTAADPTPNPGVCDYFEARSLFVAGGANPGLASQSWTTRTGRPLSDLVSECMDVLVQGIYR